MVFDRRSAKSTEIRRECGDAREMYAHGGVGVGLGVGGGLG